MADLNPSQKDWLKKEVLKWSDKGVISEYQIDDILKEYNIQFKPKKRRKTVECCYNLPTATSNSL